MSCHVYAAVRPTNRQSLPCVSTPHAFQPYASWRTPSKLNSSQWGCTCMYTAIHGAAWLQACVLLQVVYAHPSRQTCSLHTDTMVGRLAGLQGEGKPTAGSHGKAGQRAGEARRGCHLSWQPLGRHVCWAGQQPAGQHVSLWSIAQMLCIHFASWYLDACVTGWHISWCNWLSGSNRSRVMLEHMVLDTGTRRHAVVHWAKQSTLDCEMTSLNPSFCCNEVMFWPLGSQLCVYVLGRCKRQMCVTLGKLV